MWIKPLLIVGVLTLSSSSGESYNYHADPINAQETLLVLLIVFAFFFCVLVLIDIFNYMTFACCGRRINLILTLNLLLIYHLQNRSPRYIFHQTKVKVVFVSLHTPTIKYFVAVVGSHLYVEVSFPGDMETCTLDKIV